MSFIKSYCLLVAVVYQHPWLYKSDAQRAPLPSPGHHGAKPAHHAQPQDTPERGKYERRYFRDKRLKSFVKPDKFYLENV